MDSNANNVVCDAQETDWLDVSYSQRNYVETQGKSKPKSKFVFTKGLKILTAVVLCVAVLCTMLLVDGNFSKEVFATVKSVYSQVLSVFQPQSVPSNTITLPKNVNLMQSEQGVSTFGGGKAVLSFTSGTVQSVEENSVTVALDDNTTIKYDNLTTVFVAVGDVVVSNTLLGKYDGTFSTVIAESGEVVTQVIASATQLTWQV